MDELFAAPAPLLSITKVNQQARLLLERQFSNIGLFGEISNHKLIKGHHYFTLKDGRSELPAVLFRADAQRINFALQNGAEVEGWGRLTLYEERGRYQVILKRLSLRGVGELQQRFERLKAQLQKEGLFADERKRRLPLIPGRVAVVTSASGSVIRDIIHVAKRRLQNPDILVIPSPVQGATAAAKLEFAIRRASALSGSLGLTSLIVARGGGSL
ncbi:exodeoxyribonuclease VII large subunit, partial [Myxococcota bacterium]|nr:exodeoxyribonuclease VII large subunit [Myxococcota bacterium]